MIFLGNGCDVICITPIGRQCASGLSLLLSAIRCFTNSAAHGWYGAPPESCAPMLPNTDPEGPAGGPGAAAGGAGVPAAGGVPGAAAAPGAAGGAAGRGGGSAPHTPDKFGFPSAARGGGALKSGLPSAVNGTPEGIQSGHCASTGADIATTSAKPKTTPRRLIADLQGIRPRPRNRQHHQC